MPNTKRADIRSTYIKPIDWCHKLQRYIIHFLETLISFHIPLDIKTTNEREDMNTFVCKRMK